MNSTTTIVAKQCRLETRAQQIQDCNSRPQGMSVKDWCSQHGVNVAKFDKETIIQLFLAQQEQLKDIDQKLQLVLEQVAVLNNKHF